MERLRYHDILYNDDPIGPWPTHLLKRVAKPTNEVVGPVERRDERESTFGKSLYGEYGKETQREFARLITRYPVGAALFDLQMRLKSVVRKGTQAAPKRAPIPEDPRVRSRHLKALGYFLGADVMGVGPLAESAIYTYDMEGTQIEVPFKYAVVFLCRKHAPTMAASNGWEGIVDAASWQAYQRLALQTETMAEYLRRLGWEAQASNTLGYSTLMPQVVLDAGLGEVSRMGIILNPFLGCSFKSACVLTNMELECDGYIDFGLQEYCGGCTLCADQCPPHAIPRGPKTLHNGYRTWKLNSKACSDFAVFNKEGAVCGRCTKVCPWHIPGQEPRDFADWDGDLEWLHKRIDEQRERVIGNGYVDVTESTQKWWFPLDEVNGELLVPTAKNPHKICREYPLQNRGGESAQ